MRTMMVGLVAVAAFAGGPMVASAGDISVTDPFARASAGAAQVGAAFMTLKNAGTSADKLVAAQSPIAARTELHTHIKDGDIVRMREIPAIDIPAGATVALQPGGLHVMLIDLKAPLSQGETFPLTLEFEQGGAMTVQVPVKSAAEMAPMHQPKH